MTSAVDKLNEEVQKHRDQLQGVPISPKMAIARFLIYAALMKKFGIEHEAWLNLAKRMGVDAIEIQPVESKYLN